MDLRRLKAIAGYLGLDSSFASRARLLDEIPHALVKMPPEALLDGVGRTDRYRLLAAVALEKTTDLVGGAFFRSAGDGVYSEALASRGLLVKEASVGRPRVPAEIIDGLARALAGSYKLPSVKRPDKPIYLSAGSAVVDLTTLWAETFKRPIPLTKTGTISRRTLGRITPLLSVDEEESPLYDVFTRLGVSRSDLLVNYALARRAVVRTTAGLSGNADYLTNVLGAFPGLVTDMLADAAAGAGAAAAVAVFALREHPAGKWFRYSDLVLVVKRADDEKGAATAGLVVAALSVAGALEAGFAEDEFVFNRVTELDACGEPYEYADGKNFLIGGNFEVQVPAYIRPADRLKLEAFADMKSSGHYLTYVISRESFYRALDDGLTGEEIKAFLESRSAKSPPQNLVFSLDEWAGHYGEVGFIEGTFLVTEDPGRLEEIAKVTELAGKLGEPMTFYGFKIHPKDYGTIYDSLTIAGFMPATLDAWRGAAPGRRVRLFRGDTRTETPTPRSSAVTPVEMLISAVEFALEKRRRIRFYLAGGERVEGVPCRLSKNDWKSIDIDADGETVSVSAAEVESFEFI